MHYAHASIVVCSLVTSDFPPPFAVTLIFPRGAISKMEKYFFSVTFLTCLLIFQLI